ncbi:hypothetical protein Pyn_10421 [Prunus yedoensis var. nudiflora]|uniref:Uncharacterized protein n=1 Tax=Prunus yedoensis var. nudiflora TaxID=2094558 RepID=A0A314YSK3_PRUYE|nr:hypothetical protein Pyn_28665 [Prunus yedoensis var. nudiflora]PQQ17430.1 hypothetical protein Pyn_10421 [Prunus yedoensis var. nudiflora]
MEEKDEATVVADNRKEKAASKVEQHIYIIMCAWRFTGSFVPLHSHAQPRYQVYEVGQHLNDCSSCLTIVH